MSKKENLDIIGSVTPQVDVPHLSKSRKEIINQKLKELMQEEGRLVKGIFNCFDDSAGSIKKITYKKYPTPAEMRKRGSDGGIEPFSKEMIDGCEYEIPLYVARFLNGVDITAGLLGDSEHKTTNIGTCSYAVHGFKMSGTNLAPSVLGSGPKGEMGIPVPMIGVSKRVKRYGFQSLEFANGAA